MRPAFHHVPPVGELEGHADILFHEQYRHPCCLMDFLDALNRFFTMRGARPKDISSRRSNSGSLISALPTSTICCSPPDRVPAFWLLRSPARGTSGAPNPGLRLCAFRARLRKAPSPQVLEDCHVAKDRFSSGTMEMPISTIR